MRLTSLSYAPYRLPFVAPYVTAAGTTTAREGLILRLEADDGVVGLGEAAPVPEAGVGVATLERALQDMAPPLLARLALDPRATTRWPPGDNGGPRSAVRCALDVAVCDLLARSDGIGMARALSKRAAPEVAVNALIGGIETSQAVAVALTARSQGFRAVKLKVGTLADVAAERARIAAVRDALGPDVALRLDANGAWGFGTARALLASLDDLDIEYVEDPLHFEAAAGLGERMQAMARLQAAVPLALAADEEVTDLAVAERLLQCEAARVLILKPQRLGGVRPALQIAEMARRANARVVVTTAIESGVGTAACLRLAAALGAGAPAHGLATSGLLAADLVETPIPAADGVMRLPEGAGLGAALSARDGAYLGPWRTLC